MSTQRSVRLFRNGRNQAVRIPRDLELPGTEALIRKEGDALVIVPKQSRSLLATLRTLRPLPERFPEIEELPIEPVEIEP
jgi:antitoxin VapB